MSATQRALYVLAMCLHNIASASSTCAKKDYTLSVMLFFIILKLGLFLVLLT